MQLTLAALAALAAITTAAPAVDSGFAGPLAIVNNQCSYPIYVQSVPNDGGDASVVTRVRPQTSFVEAYQKPSGSAIRIAKSSPPVNPLTMEYTPTDGRVFYDLSNNAGNPFSNVRNTLIPKAKGCARFNCGPGQSGCYSNGADPKIKNCKATTLTTTICA